MSNLAKVWFFKEKYVFVCKYCHNIMYSNLSNCENLFETVFSAFKACSNLLKLILQTVEILY